MSSIKEIFVGVKNGTNRWKLKKEVGGRGVERGGGVAEEGWGEEGGGGGGEEGEGHFCILFLLPTHMNPPFTFLSSPIPLPSLFLGFTPLSLYQRPYLLLVLCSAHKQKGT